jgi:O-antigen/teichoic acid export membrane protein
MKTPADVGIYSAAAKLVTVFLFIPIMTFQVTTPLMYRYSQENREKYQRINQALWRYLAAFGVPAGVGLSLLAPEIIDLVYGAEYAASVAVLQVMGWFLAIRFCGISQGNSLTTTDRQGLRALIQIISVGINIGLDIWLIREYGAAGAAIATTITEAVIISCYLYFSARYLNESILRNLASLVPVALATAGMAGLILLAKPYLHVIVLVILGAVSYGFFLWISRFFRAYDRQILQQIFRKS